MPGEQRPGYWLEHWVPGGQEEQAGPTCNDKDEAQMVRCNIDDVDDNDDVNKDDRSYLVQ